MKKFLFIIALVFAPFTANAQQRSYTYYEMCWYRQLLATCKITDVRILDKKYNNEYLDKRIIEAKVKNSNQVFTVKSWFDKEGFKTWDSDRNYTYSILYKPVSNPGSRVIREANLPPNHAITEVTKNLWVRQIPWD